MTKEKNKKYAYGLDLSMTCSGIAVFDMDTFEPVLVTSITTNAKEEWGDRLFAQKDYIEDIVEQYPPTIIYFERGFTQFNTATQVIFRVVGVFNETLREYPQEYIVPGTIKKKLHGKGNCSKEALQKVIASEFPQIDFQNTDESDAVGVVVAGLVMNHKMKWVAPHTPK